MTPSVTSFFQIILNSTFHEKKMKFPNKFVHELGNELYGTVRLSVPIGCCWDVKVKREDDGTIWLHDGFRKFMEENSIGIGYFLTFKYEGNSKFAVHIFDLTATEILYSRRSDSERCDVNKLQTDETREGGDDTLIYEVSDDDIDDSSRYESGDEDIADDGDKASGDRVDDFLNNGSVDKDSDDDIDDSFMSESSDEDTDDDDDGDESYIYERRDKFFKNGLVDSPKYENGYENSDDSSVKCLGTTIDHLSPQLFAESSVFASKNKKNVGASRETTRARRGYLTRRKKQIMEGGVDANGSMCSGPGSNSSPRDIAKETPIRAKKINPMAPSSFRVTLKLYHLTNGMLRVPCSFARSYMSSSTAPIKLVDSNNKEWEVVYVHPPYREHDYVLSKGWKQFVRKKGLMVGDTCVFEYLEGIEEVKIKEIL